MMRLIEKAYDSIAHVCVHECERDEGRCRVVMTAEQLTASCPFCERGAHLTLETGRWVSILDSRDLQTQLQVTDKSEQPTGSEKGATDEIKTHLNARLFGPYFNHLADAPDSETMRCEVPEGENAYGVSLGELERHNPQQLRLPLMDSSSVRTYHFGISGPFAGLYECPHCGRIFAVGFWNPAQQADGDSSMQLRVANALHELAQETRDQPPQAADVTLARVPAGIVVRAVVEGVSHEAAFDTARGTARLDGTSYVRGELSGAIFEHPLVASGTFAIPVLVRKIAALLPALPYEPAWDWSREGSPWNMRMLMMANRFIGYPEAFYREELVHAFAEVYPLHGGLPRHYEDVQALYPATGLPETKSLKRALFTRPTLLHALLKAGDVPFENVDMLQRLFAHENARQLIELLNLKERSCAGWHMLARAKGEDVVMRYLLQRPQDEIRDLSLAFASSEGNLWNATGAFRTTPMREIGKLVECLDWQSRHPELALDEPYTYTEADRHWEDSVGPYVFELPQCPRDLVVAGAEMHNCLRNYAAGDELDESEVLVLMRKNGRAVAAIIVAESNRVHTALGAGNTEICCTPLESPFHEWRRRKGLRFLPERDIDF